MENLPVEILLDIFDFLDAPQLAVVNRLNKWFYHFAAPKLYSVLTFQINPYTLDLTYKSTLLLEKLLRTERLCAFVRALTFEFVHEVWEARLRRTNTQLLIIGALLLKNPQIRSNLRSFRWRLGGEASGLPINILLDAPTTLTSLVIEASQAPLSVCFPLLRDFECRNIASLDQASWVKLQFVHARSLHTACLSVGRDFPNMPVTRLIPDQLQAPSLKCLRLEYVDIDQWPGQSLETVEHISFRYCHQVCNGLLLSPRAKRSLSKFELVSYEPHPYLGAFFSDLANYTSLSHVALLLAQSSCSIPIAWLKPHRLSLRSLTIECRQNRDSYLSTYHYSVQDVVDTMNAFPRLQHLGVPVLLNGVGKELCKYMKVWTRRSMRKFGTLTFSRII